MSIPRAAAAGGALLAWWVAGAAAAPAQQVADAGFEPEVARPAYPVGAGPLVLVDEAEVEAVRLWVERGGALLLIADHMPFPGAAYSLAAEFGALFGNGFALDGKLGSGEMRFRRSDGSLVDHAIVRGGWPGEAIDSVVAFTGQAFRLMAGGEPILRLGPGSVLVMPERTWEYTEHTPRIPAEGMLQGAVLRFGEGRVAVFGEAGMFTAQLAGPEGRPMGMNAPHARQNAQFVLNVFRWPSGGLDGGDGGPP